MNTKNLKPFDLQAALHGDPVMLRDGSKAFVRHYEAEQKVNDESRLFGVVVHEWSTCTVMTWSTQGRFYGGLVGDSSLDIIGMWTEPRITRIINGFEVPAPETEEPRVDSVYFSTTLLSGELYGDYAWANDNFDLTLLKRGLVFLTKEDAIANAKAMLGINPYEESE